MRLETLGALSAFAASALAVEQGGAASTVGLSLSYALQVTALTNMVVRNTSTPVHPPTIPVTTSCTVSVVRRARLRAAT